MSEGLEVGSGSGSRVHNTALQLWTWLRKPHLFSCTVQRRELVFY